MMPPETKEAVNWALEQKDDGGNPVTIEMCHVVVDKVREYFNQHHIVYPTFSYDDLKPYLPQ